ncbi:MULTISPECIES: D-2-hydroxyacid dehydrogenase family protein [Ramlibacter]|uniref:D-2-hydroxyacid dehydrogenase family protein n=1 Tax=Ramlibacter pinisoli TaxID=2682844 RepID=A0A6N8IZE8_9BURK|nr:MULTISPECIES: D-2-hydroxyacid dehydrogenase family protein [Ramlibacter]MBA2961999.1 D-2-hydroxyacid dehydrogenase family protein [Ramlibacter sp. CGMCC 1.13660]MVQ31942.1 D-2-hydroxyacid dehydrogenase family protein [Ramlibacter pinisoli]
MSRTPAPSPRPRVVLMEDYLDQARTMPCVQELARHTDLAIYTDKARSKDELLQRLAGARAAITIRDRVLFDSDVFARVQELELLSVCGPRLQPHVDLDAATRAGVLVCCAPPNSLSSVPHHATAELAWTLILGLARNVVHNQAVLRAGGWQTVAGVGLVGKTLGVIGSTGKVGSIVARLGLAFGMRVIAWSPRLTAEKAAGQGIEAVTLEELLGSSDVVSLHANVTAQSRSMLGDAEFARMKPGAILVNTARAALVDEQALRRALDAGPLAGAGLDVFWDEPLPQDHWVRRHDKVLLQPHLGAFTPEGYEWIVAPGVEAALAWLRGEALTFANPEAAAVAGRPA